MSDNITNYSERRGTTERRTRVFRTMLGCLIDRRRDHPQRLSERQQPYYSDFYESWLFVLIVGIVLLSVADAVLTLNILAQGGVELNPVMDAILAHGPLAFFAVKYGLTSVGLIFCVLHIRYQLLRIIPMRTVLIFIMGIYLVLVAYEISILLRI
ncbi:MAG: DUF5658 family protein [Methylococcales bacterium]